MLSGDEEEFAGKQAAAILLFGALALKQRHDGVVSILRGNVQRTESECSGIEVCALSDQRSTDFQMSASRGEMQRRSTL